MSEDNDQPIDSDESNQEINDFDIGKLLSDKVENRHILCKYAKQKNISEALSDEKIQELTYKVISGIGEDQQSMAKWLMNVEAAQKLARLEKEAKNTPLPQSANIKFPLITDACYQFAARTYPELIQDGKVVKMDIIGMDNDGKLEAKGELISNHMNYQLLGPDSTWEAGMDKLLIVYSNTGFTLKKTYYDSLNKKNCSDLCSYKDIILRNDDSISSLSDLRRITHVLHCHPNDLIENARAGIYSESVVDEIMNFYSATILNPECDFYECHCFADLDDDGYEEPYIVTLHKQTQKIVRVNTRFLEEDIKFDDSNKVLRINPVQYFTDYGFLPAPDGSFLSIGFGTLLLHLNEMVNTIFNQLTDAGTLANLQTGFIDSRIKIMGGQTAVDPGQWSRVKGVMGITLKDGVFPLNYKEPSSVLFQLLGMLIETAKELTSSTDALQGMGPSQNVPATTQLSQIEQGLKRFSAIQKRFWRSNKEEYQKLFRLNRLYTDPKEFAEITGNYIEDPKEIYSNKSLRIFPIADPNLSSDAQRLAQSQVVMSLVQLPGIEKDECYMTILKAAKLPHPERFIDGQMIKKAKTQPDPKMMKVQADAANHQQQNQIKGKAQDLKEKEFTAKLAKIEAEITQMQAHSVNLMAQAKSTEHGDAMDEHAAGLETIKTKLNAIQDAHQQMTDSNVSHAQLQIQKQQADQDHQHQMTQMALQMRQQNVDANHGQQQLDQGQQALDQQPTEAPNDQAQPNNSVDGTSDQSSTD